MSAKAAKLLEGEDTTASAVLFAAIEYFGRDLMELEPETLRITAGRNKLKIPEHNWEALFAATALRGDGRFMYDANVFENTVLAFNQDGVVTDATQIATPVQIAWAVSEAGVIAHDLIPSTDKIDDYFDYEITGYTAASCIHEGLLAVPQELDFCEDRLIYHLSPDMRSTASDVKKAWAAIENRVSQEQLGLFDTDDELQSQLHQLSVIRLYVAEMTRLRVTQLASIGLSG